VHWIPVAPQGETREEELRDIKETIQVYLDAKGTKDLGQIELIGIQFDEAHTE
jgi:predicted RNase H-like HicB family nuclease